MDQEIREILREAKSKGATQEQLQRIADAYFEAKKKNQGASGLKEPGTRTASTASQSRSGGVGLSTRPTLAAAAGKPEVQTPSESVRSGLKPAAGRQLETGEGIRGLTDAEKFKREQEKAEERGLLLVTKEEAEKRRVDSYANTAEFIGLRPATMLAGAATFMADLYDTSVSTITGGNVRPKTSEEIGKLAYALSQEEAELNKRILGEDVANKGLSQLYDEGNIEGAAKSAALGLSGLYLDILISRKVSNPFVKAYAPTGMKIPQTLNFTRAQFAKEIGKKAFDQGIRMFPLALKSAGYKIEEVQREQAQADVFDDLKTLGVGTVIGAVEVASEAMFRTSVDDLLINGFTKNFVSDLYKANKPILAAARGTAKETLTQSVQEGTEELVAGIADIVIDGTLYNKDMFTEANAFSLIDSFILGSLFAGPTTLLSYGPSSVGKASSINARRKVIDDLNTSYDKLSDESLSPLEKMEIKKGIETKLGMLAGIQKQDSDFYELFSEEDKMAALTANQKITMGQVLLSKIDDPDARFNIEQELKKAYSEKTKVESKYDPNIKVYEYVGQEGKPVPSAEQTGKAAVQAEPVQEAGTRTPETDRIFQALGQDETLGAMERGEEVYEDDAVAAQERILGLIDQVNSLDLPQKVKDQYIEVLGEKFEDLEYYDNKTTVSVEESTQRRPVGAPKRVIREKVGERASTGFPRLRNYERLNNSQVTTGTEAEGEVSVIEEQEDGTVALVSYKDGVKATSRPLANSLLDLEYVESVFDNDGTLTGVVMRPKTAKGQPESTETFTISNKPELAMDIAIQAKTEQVGSVAQADFEYAFEEVTTKKVVKKKMPVQERPAKPAKPEPVVQKKEVNAPTKQDLNSLIESDPARAEVYAAMLTSMDLLNGYYPDARFVLTENDAETNEYLTENDPGYDGGNVDGQFFQNKNTGEIEILINKQRARTPEVVFHEVFHAGFAKVYGQNVEKAKEFMQSLKKILNTGNAQEIGIAKKIDDFLTSGRYTKEESSEEYLAEGSGILAANKSKLSAGMVNKLKNFFNRIAKVLKMKPIFKEAATTVEVVDFLNGFIRGVNSISSDVAPDLGQLDADRPKPGEPQTDVTITTPEWLSSRSSKADKFGFIRALDIDSDKAKRLKEDGYISEGHELDEFFDKFLIIHAPDNAFTGNIAKEYIGEDGTKSTLLLVRGKGGVFYPMYFHERGYFWAATKTSANTMADDLNKVAQMGDGKIRMMLLSGKQDKLLSSSLNAQGVIDILESKAFSKEFGLTNTQLKKSLVFGINDLIERWEIDKAKGPKAPLSKISKEQIPSRRLKESESYEDVVSFVREFLQQENSIFGSRKRFIQSVLDGVSKNVTSEKTTKQFREFLGIKTKGDKISSASLSEGFSKLLTEPMLEGVQSNMAYAVLEIEGPVEVFETSTKEGHHESYPFAIRSATGAKTYLKLLKHPYNWMVNVDAYKPDGLKKYDLSKKPKDYTKIVPTTKGTSTVVKLSSVKSKSSKAPAKNIGGEKYFHHSYLDAHIEQNDGTLTYENVTRAEQSVKKALRDAGVTIKFNTFKYNPSTKVLTFQEGRGFDTMREPVVGHSIGVNLSTGKVVSGFKSDGSLRAPSEAIWHNKWQWVDDTYTGFDVEAAKAWSEEWGSKFATGERRDIGKKENWDNKLREKGLPVEGTAVMSRSRLEPELVAPNVQIVKNPYTGVEHTIELPMSSGGTSIPQKNHVVTDFIKNSKKSPQNPEDIKRFASIGAGKKTFNGKASPSHEMMRDRLPNAEIYLLDPENISPEENLAELDKLFSRPADAAEAANVLNVIPDKAMRNNVIQSVYDVLDEGGWAYFKIFVGSKQNKTLGQAYKEGTLAYGDNKELNEELYKQNKEQGIADDSFYYSRQTGKDKMQVNQRAPFYQPEVEAVFGDKGFVDNDIIVVQKTTEVKSKSRADFSVVERFETADVNELANYKSGRIYSTKWTGSAKAAESIEKKLINEGFEVNVRVASTNSRYVEFYRESDQKEGVIRVSGHGRIGDITLETRTREAVGKTGKPYEFKEVFFTVNSNIDFADDFFEANVMTSKSFEATKEALDSFISAPKSKSSREWVEDVQLEVRAKLQDRMARVLKIQEDIQSYIGGTVPLNFDFKNAEARLPGVVRDLQDKTMDKAEEIVKLFSSEGLNPEQFGDLLYALHAQERNKAVRIRTTDIPMSLKTLRQMFDLTPTEAAKNAGIPVDVYRSIEVNGNATEQELTDIVESYGMTTDEFFREFARNNEGSGMSDLEARDILSNYGVKNLDKPLASMLPAKLAKAVSMSHEINQQTRDLLVSSGLETREIVDAYEYAYDNYVPLRGFVPEEDGDEVETFIEGGRRLPVRGKIKRAMGRYSKSDDPFTQLIAQNFNVIARAKKNEAMQKLYNLTDDVKNPEVYKAVDTSRDVKYKEQFVNGKQVRVPVSSRTYSNDPRYVSVRFNGIDRFIKFEDPRMVEALNGMNIQQTNAIFSVFKTINRAMTATITVYDPEFVLRNFSRDIQMSLINVMAEQELVDGLASGEKIVGNTMKGVPKSFKAIFDAQRGNENNTKYAQYYKDFLEDGGQIETFYGGTSKEVGESVQNLFDKENRDSSGRLVRLKESTMKASFGLIKDINSSVENAIRLSAYIAAREAGVSREKAAELGKKVTVDFNRTGEYGQFMNSLYLFFNASIQGSSRLIRTLKPVKVDGKLVVTRPQKIAIGLVAFGAILSLVNAAISGDDEEDGKSWYSKIPDYEKERNMIFMNPFDKQGKDYFKVPLPYGLNIFYVLGNSIADVSLGENKLAEAFTNVALSIVSNFSPIGFPTSENPEKRLLKMITPSVFQPIAGIALNEDFTGRPVYSENLPFDKTPLPDSELGKKAGPVATNLAKTLNEVTGGSSVRSGSTDVNPDVLEYILNYYTGGVGKTSSRVGKLAYAGIKGELKDVKPNDVPLARVFYGTAYDRIDYAGFYKKVSNVYQLNEEIKLGRRSGSEANRIKVTLAEAKAVDKRLRDIRKKEKEGKIQEDRAEDLRNAIMKNFLRDYDKRKIDDI